MSETKAAMAYRTSQRERDLRDRIDYLRAVLLEQATDQHIYRRDNDPDPDSRFGHRGSFKECGTLRCENARSCLAQTAPR